jgi:YfiH family protein
MSMLAHSFAATPPPGQRVTERLRPEAAAAGVPLWEHPGWAARFPWLIQGVTAARLRPEEPAFDLALFGDGVAGKVMQRWTALGRATGVDRVVHGRQVHGAAVRAHGEGPPGLQVSPLTDGHATRAGGVLLTVSVADCVPISLVSPARRVVALLHGGWRGVAAGILENGLDLLAGRLDASAGELDVHLGPAICGACYEVGPEVHRALGLPEPGRPQPVDLRAVIAERARRAGVADARITTSTWCTRCGESPFFSHRGGCAERQVAVLGIAHG